MKKLAFLLGLALTLGCQPVPDSFDLIIEGGTVYDGTGADPVQVDVGIVGDRIAAMGDLSDKSATRRISAENQAVVPGFIDIHSHAAGSTPQNSGIFRHPEAENYIRQGVTTAIGGPDGGSPMAIGPFLDALEAQPATINFGTFFGHGTVRRLVMGNADRAPEPAELDSMKALITEAMTDGAFGLSSGLKYPPGTYAATEEVIELSKVAADRGGIYISHIREEGLDLLPSVEEVVRIGEEAGLPAQVTHHKAIGKSMWGSSVQTLDMVDAARARGLDISIDQYPYTASSTGLTILFPAWSLAGSQQDLLDRLRNPETRASIKEKIVFNLEKDRGGGNPANVAVAYCPWDTTLNGMNLATILEAQNRAVTVENAAELAMELQEKGGFQGIFHAMDEADVARIMQHPYTMIASDGGIPTFGRGVPHPRNYGTFARVLGRYVREQNLMPFAEAIRKMTQLPAERIGLTDRGVLRVGAVADVVLLDPETIWDTATFTDPHQYAVGVEYVLVSGELVLDQGTMTAARPGKVLRHAP